MPKRSAEEEIAYYSKKLKKLKRKEKKRRKRVLVYSDSSEGEENYGKRPEFFHIISTHFLQIFFKSVTF